MNYEYSSSIHKAQETEEVPIVESFEDEYLSKIHSPGLISNFESPRIIQSFDKIKFKTVNEALASKDTLLLRCRNNIEELQITLNKEK